MVFSLGRIAPSTPKVSISGFSAQIGWKISESVEKRIKCVYVKLNGEEIEVEMKGLRLANISLKPNESYTTSVVAVYEDDVKAESEKVYFKTPGNILVFIPKLYKSTNRQIIRKFERVCTLVSYKQIWDVLKFVLYA